MTLSLTIGWWILPLALTFGSVIGALWDRPNDHGGFIPSPMPLVRFAGAVILSMAAWIGYLLILVLA